MDIIFSQFALGLIFLTIVFLHLTKKNFSASAAYAVQSVAVIAFLVSSYLETKNNYLLLIVLLTIIVKVILSQVFFIRLIRKHELPFSVSTYVNTPITLVIIAILTFVAHSQKLSPLTSIIPANQALLSLALSAILISLFLIVNRKGVFSQIIGVLSLENSIVAFIIFAGLEQSPALQAGIIFNIFIWVIIATVFASMIYEHFGSHDITTMKNLKD